MQQEASGSGQPAASPRGRLAQRFTLATAAHRQRRRIATVCAVVIAALVGYHALLGENGLLAYQAKRQEDQVLRRQLEQIKVENSRLKAHVDHLKNDPDAIEYEAHTRLRYTRPDQVIVLNNEPDAKDGGPVAPIVPRRTTSAAHSTHAR